VQKMMFITLSCVLVLFASLLINVSSLRQLKQWQRSSCSSAISSSPRSLTDETKRGLVSAVLPSFMVLLAAIKPANADKSDKRFYLDAPTADFVEEEKRTAALSAEGQKLRKAWDAAEVKMGKAETPAEKEGALREFIAILNKIDGVPPGVKKIPLVKLCRSKKFSDAKMRKRQDTWTKDVEIAYQELIFLFNKKVAPDNRGAEKI